MAAKNKPLAPKKPQKSRRVPDHLRQRAPKVFVGKTSECPDVRGRLEIISGLMRRLEWVRGKTGEELAEKWGLSVKTVEMHSAECSRQITADPDEARRDITAACRFALRRAMASGNDKSLAAIGTLWARVSGAMSAERHEIVTATANPAEAARLVREAFGDKALPEKNGNTKS